MMQKAKWAAARMAFLIAVSAGAATGGALVCLLGPLYSWYFFKDLSFWKYLRYLSPMVIAYWKLGFELTRSPAYRGMFAIPLTAPPMTGPDLSLVRVSASWREDGGACNGCDQCCTWRCCPLLDTERKLCKSYGSFFWRYFNCGRYPENIKQIRFYECPKWEMNGAPEKAKPA